MPVIAAQPEQKLRYLPSTLKASIKEGIWIECTYQNGFYICLQS